MLDMAARDASSSIHTVAGLHPTPPHPTPSAAIAIARDEIGTSTSSLPQPQNYTIQQVRSGHATYGGGDHGDTRIAAHTLSGDQVRVVHLRGRLARRTDQQAGEEIGKLWIRISGKSN